MVRHAFTIVQYLLQDFYVVSDHFGTLCIKRLLHADITKIQRIIAVVQPNFLYVFISIANLSFSNN